MYEKNKEKNNNIVLLIIIGVIIIIGILVYYLFFRNKDVNAKNYTDWLEIEKTKYSINILEESGNVYFEGENKDIETYNKLGTYYCIYKKCNGILVLGDAPYAVIKDGSKYVLFDYKSNIYKNLKISEDINNIDILYYYNKAYGLVLSNNSNKYKVYSLFTNSFLSDYKYSNYENNSASLINDLVFLVNRINDEEAKYEIVDLKNGSIKFESTSIYLQNYRGYSRGDEKNVYYLVPRLNDDYYVYDLYNNSFKKIATTNYEFLEVDSKGNAIILKNNNYFEFYNKDGNVIKTSKYYKKIIMLFKNYLFVVDVDNYIKLIDFNENAVTNFELDNDDYLYHTDLSGWNEKDNEDAIYLVVEDVTAMDDEDNKGFEYYYIPTSGKKGKTYTTMIGGYEKPVIYLYPKENKTLVNINFEKPNLLLTTYPKYNTEWNVIANKNGDLKDLNNKYYYGLYYEEKGSSNISFEEGFYVTKENAIDFLEEKLSVIGLNERERNEFIMYWLPILEKNGKSVVYFELTESREKYNKLIVTPKVDSMLRVSIHIKKVNKKINIKEQKLTTFERQGFTLVEWGGVNHK